MHSATVLVKGCISEVVYWYVFFKISIKVWLNSEIGRETFAI